MDLDGVQSVLDRAEELLGAGQPAESLRCLEALDGDLIDADAHIECASLKGWALSELGRGDEALDVLERVLDEYPQSARLYAARGVVLSSHGELDEACETLEQAIALDPTDEVAVANLGLVYEKLGQYEEALCSYEQAMGMGAEIDWLLQRKAAVQAELGQLDAARSTLKRYLSLAPDDVEQWITLALLHSDEEEFAQAFRCYRAAEQIAPDSAALRLNWGVTAVQAHQMETARQQLRYLARLEPHSSRALLLEALINEEQGKLKEATAKYADALGRVRDTDYPELTYALETSMEFFARHRMLGLCEQLLERAYLANACTVGLCEAYREVSGELVAKANWHSLIVEGDYRPGLEELLDPGGAVNQPPTRFLRNYQVIAKDHDEAVALVMQFAERMGESNVLVREFAGEEAIPDAHIGVYEVERESLVFAGDGFE